MPCAHLMALSDIVDLSLPIVVSRSLSARITTTPAHGKSFVAEGTLRIPARHLAGAYTAVKRFVAAIRLVVESLPGSPPIVLTAARPRVSAHWRYRFSAYALRVLVGGAEIEKVR